MKITKSHVYFWGGVFSQWCKSEFTAPIVIQYPDGKSIKTDPIEFNCCEQFMMAGKALAFNDVASFASIMATKNPEAQKAIGRQVKNYDDSVWSTIRYDIVVQANMAKFKQNASMLDFLLSTGDKVIVEGSPYDKIWGVGIIYDSPRILDEKNWQGQNLLGEAIMEVREKLKCQVD